MKQCSPSLERASLGLHQSNNPCILSLREQVMYPIPLSPKPNHAWVNINAVPSLPAARQGMACAWPVERVSYCISLLHRP